MQSSERRFIQRDAPSNKVEHPKSTSNYLYPNATVIPDALRRNLQTDQKVVKEFRGADALLRMFYFQLMKLAFQGHHQKDYVKILRGILVGQDLFQKGQLEDRQMTDSQYRGKMSQFLDLMSSQIVPNFEVTAQNNPVIDDVLRKYFRKIVPITLYLNENHWELAKNVLTYLSQVFEVNFKVIGEFFRFDQSDFLVLVVRKDLIFATYAHDFRHISEVDQNSSSVLQLNDKQTSNKAEVPDIASNDLRNLASRKTQMEQLASRIAQKVKNSRSLYEPDIHKSQPAAPNQIEQYKRERDRSKDSVNSGNSGNSVTSVNSVNGVKGGSRSRNSLAYFPRIPRSNSLKNEEIINAYYSHENAVYLNHQTNDICKNQTAKFITPSQISLMTATQPRSRTSRLEKPLPQQVFSATSEYGFEKKPELSSSQNYLYSRYPVAYQNQRIGNQINAVPLRNNQGFNQIQREARKEKEVQKEVVLKRNEPTESPYKSRGNQQRKEMLNSQKRRNQYRKQDSKVNEFQNEAVRGSNLRNNMPNEVIRSSREEEQRRNELQRGQFTASKTSKQGSSQQLSYSIGTQKVAMELMGKLTGRKQERKQYLRSSADGNNGRKEQLVDSQNWNEKTSEILIEQESKGWRESLHDRQARKESPVQAMVKSRSNGEMEISKEGKEGRTLILRDSSGKQKLMVIEERALYDIPLKQSQRNQSITLSQRLEKQYYLQTEDSGRKISLRHEIPFNNIREVFSTESLSDSKGISQQQSRCEDNPIARLARSQDALSLFKKTSSKVIDVPLSSTPDQAPCTVQRTSMNQARHSATAQVSLNKNGSPKAEMADSKLGRVSPPSRPLENQYMQRGSGKVLQAGEISNKSNHLAKAVRDAVESFGLSKSQRQKENQSTDPYGLLPLNTIDPVQIKPIKRNSKDSFVDDFAKDSFLDMIEEGLNTKILQISKQYREKKLMQSQSD